MITIKKGGVQRKCSESDYKIKYKSLGYVLIDEIVPSVVPDPVPNIPDPVPVDIEQYSKGGGWYLYEGKSYRKADLIKKLGEIK